jgi:hypothetical protein
MARPPTKIRLQKTLKEGLRRCIYRRWEATLKRSVLITKTTELERLYRGNTPYPIVRPKITLRTYDSPSLAKQAQQRAHERRKSAGYRPA